MIYSNAALHWLEDHDGCFPALFAALAPGGTLAVQMPRNFAAPSHTLDDRGGADGPWREVLEPLLRPAPVAAPDFYYDLLAPLARVASTSGRASIYRCSTASTRSRNTPNGLAIPLLAALDEPQRSRFEAAYTERVPAPTRARPDGKTLFPFRRLFLIATRA